MGGGDGRSTPPAGFADPGTLAVLMVFTLLLSTIAGVGSAMRAATARDILRADGAERIEISPLPSMGTRGRLNAEKLTLVESVDGVRQVVPDYTSSLRSPRGGELPRVSLRTRSWGSTVRPPLTAGTVPNPLPPDQIVVPAHVQGVDFRAHLGERVRMNYTVPPPPKPAASEEESGERERTRSGPDDEAEDEQRAQAASVAHSASEISETIELRIAATYDPRWHADGPDTAYVAPRTAAVLAAAAEGTTAERVHAVNGADRVGVVVEKDTDPAEVAARLREMGLGAFPLVDRERNLIRTVEVWYYIALLGVLVSAVLLGFRGVGRFTAAGGSGEGALVRGAALGLGVGVLATGLGVLGALVLRAPMEEFLGLRIQWFTLVPDPRRALIAAVLPALATFAGAAVGYGRSRGLG
ncbi:hypothetical protein [Actinopolyspora mortivallis]|uniref:hypothetical protein n=1 Tax=Actinopolyspora mortivallis TaxID=33906 RepID=UPI000371EA72|nr:hypothetical protein [Actinopolyspora mortivallis]